MSLFEFPQVWQHFFSSWLEVYHHVIQEPIANCFIKWRPPEQGGNDKVPWQKTGVGSKVCVVSSVHRVGFYQFFVRSNLRPIFWKAKAEPHCMHCKYFQCNFYNFYSCPSFQCNPTLPLTFMSITAPSTVEQCKHWFTVVYCNIYIFTL